MTESSVTNETSVLTVWELTRSIRSLLESEVGTVWVEGEISNYRKQSSGHQYFTLKDERSQLSCVLFRGQGGLLGGPALADGQHVQIFGDLTVYELRGQYQMVVQTVQAKGAGALQARFEALKRKLDAEGLFDPARKQDLPTFPTRVGIVTSPTGAALQDMLNILRRRAPWLRVVIHPVRVQGQGASVEIARAIEDFNRLAPSDDHGKANDRAVDLIVVARGGGSIEDLWEFNEEIVARAIAASALPVVSAVGHEIDFTIADFAADLRAPTPSAAAELIAPDTGELLRQLAAAKQFFERQLLQFLERAHERLQNTSRNTVLREPARRIAEARQRLDYAQDALQSRVRERLAQLRAEMHEKQCCLRVTGPEQLLEFHAQTVRSWSEKLALRLCCEKETLHSGLRHAEKLLTVLGPQATLERGYTITTDERGCILRSTRVIPSGATLITLFADGEIQSVKGP